ncbi:MAG: hydroxyacid dehydrogenase [Deltaproteobacteria bacterium]|nr:hydroxyacid dehydrogenase [Deltaproteobacteria bacterium]
MNDDKPFFRVVITGDNLAPEAMKILSEKCRVVFTGPYPQPSILAQKLREEKAHALILRTGKVPAEVVKASPDLKVIAKHGAGFDNIDVQSATALKIPVLTASTANFESVAEHTLGLMFSLAKDIPWLDSRMRQGFWDKTQYRGGELYRKTLGLIGFGRIGRRVHELVAPLQMKAVVFDPFLPESGLPPMVTLVSQLDELLQAADIVSLHCPLTEQTRNLIGKRELGIMKKSAWLINTARGEVVDEEALIDALQEGKIAGAGIDTFRKEPPEDFRRLSEAGKVVLTPHIAAATEEAFVRMGIEAAQNTLTILEGRKPDKKYVANPEIFEAE